MSTEEIFNYTRIEERLITSGQPSESQLEDCANEGFEAVINIAPIDPRYSLADEQSSAEKLGMLYSHLPVAWDAPSEQDFQEFCRLMDIWADKKLLVHCAANYRVSAFYSLYAMLHLGWTKAEADSFIAERWNPAEYQPWPHFIADMRSKIESR